MEETLSGTPGSSGSHRASAKPRSWLIRLVRKKSEGQVSKTKNPRSLRNVQQEAVQCAEFHVFDEEPPA